MGPKHAGPKEPERGKDKKEGKIFPPGGRKVPSVTPKGAQKRL